MPDVSVVLSRSLGHQVSVCKCHASVLDRLLHALIKQQINYVTLNMGSPLHALIKQQINYVTLNMGSPLHALIKQQINYVTLNMGSPLHALIKQQMY